ncbi:Wzz/FepE/Etk N-terminal domain-containing protein [Streptococcus massiliensis]|uniref:Capsular polysaccharide biosynthesis protein CpsC n=1 Tax=Streptococcus massiliensis TaxID=313439 RepID=A0A380KWZ7_9STRE|nr:Wzz/FepE/Etk N-terminal domain-containing protein [Streptococcus massiliensis]SUN76462.1 MPA1 family polysaccharide export protein [Streptococcus massiliensis]
MNKQDNQTVEVDILGLLRVLWRKKFLIVLVAIVTAILALGYSLFIAKPSYQSTTRLYVVSRQQAETGGLTNQDLQAGAYLVKDYKEIILSQDVLAKAIETLDLKETPAELAKKISVVVPTDTRIVSITVKDNDPAEAARIANGVREAAAQKIIDVTKVSDVTTLEEGKAPSQPSSPNVHRNVLLGLLAGGVVTSIIVLSLEILDDRVKRPEDIEEVLGLPLLGVVPNMTKLK